MNQVVGILKALLITLLCSVILIVLEYYKAEFEDEAKDTKNLKLLSFLTFVLKFKAFIISFIGSKQEAFLIASSESEKPYNYTGLRLTTFFKIAIVRWINNSV